MKKKKEKQSEATKFLERNKIWFTAVIPTFISIGVAGAGIASCQADFKQIELTNLEIEEKNMEKQLHMTGKWCACSAPSVYL